MKVLALFKGFCKFQHYKKQGKGGGETGELMQA